MKLMLIDRARAAMRRAPAPAATVSTWVLAALLAAAPAYAVYDIPTGAPPSPLFGAEPFTQQMLLFEEFGMKSVPTSNCRNCKPFPQVADCSSSPTGAALDAYLQQTLSPLPTVESNQSEPNVWHSRIEQCLGRTLLSSYSEGRPPGVWFSHQRWNEFKPKEFVQTATAGARDNGGMRDRLQRHG
ncbi:MAG: hypothetical protein ACO377_09395 [Pseudomonadales bacterium]